MFYLKRNLPLWERALRIAAGLAIAAAAYAGLTTGIVTGLAIATALTMAATAVIGFCPACALVGRRYLDRQEK